jgi:hypothetical protein
MMAGDPPQQVNRCMSCRSLARANTFILPTATKRYQMRANPRITKLGRELVGLYIAQGLPGKRTPGGSLATELLNTAANSDRSPRT